MLELAILQYACSSLIDFEYEVLALTGNGNCLNLLKLIWKILSNHIKWIYFWACFSHLELLCGRLGGPEPPYTPWGSRAAKPRGCRRGPHGWLPRSAAHRAAHAAALPRSTAPPSNQYSSARLLVLVLARGCCEWHARAHCSLRTLVVNPCNHSGTLGDCPSSTSFMYLGFSPGSGPFWLVLGQIPFAWTKYWDYSQSNKTVRPSTSIKPLELP